MQLTNKRLIVPVIISGALSLTCVKGVNADEKHHEDPTRIVTKLGVGYSDVASVSGSLGLDEARMINARVNEEGEWRLGGSWLFDIGIINFNFSRTDYDDGGHKNNYSVGTYVPLSYFGIEPAGWMVFPTAGYSYNDGELAQPADDGSDEYVMMRSTNHAGYIGMFGVRPFEGTKWSMIGLMGVGAGSGGYSSYWGGAGLSYKLNDKASFNMFGILSEDDFGTNNKLGGSFSYQF